MIAGGCQDSGCQARQWDVSLKAAEAKIEQLRAAIEDYALWEPGRAGHAAAHRKLMNALKEKE